MRGMFKSGFLLLLSLLRAGVQPTLDPSAETVSRSSVLTQGERRGIGWCVQWLKYKFGGRGTLKKIRGTTVSSTCSYC